MHKPANVFQLRCEVYQQLMKLVAINCKECSQKITWFHMPLYTWEENVSFPSLIQVTCHVKLTNNGLVLKQLPSPLEIQSYVYLMMFWKIIISKPDLISRLHLQFLFPFSQYIYTAVVYLLLNSPGHNALRICEPSCHHTIDTVKLLYSYRLLIAYNI